jgi:hypothetical protein
MSGNMPRIQVGHFEADGSAVALTFDINPNALIAWNETKMATDATNIVFFYTDAYAAGDASIILNEADAGIGVVETTNGFTAASSVSYAETSSDVAASKTETLTFGTAVAGANSDEIHYIAFWANEGTVDHGDQA